MWAAGHIALAIALPVHAESDARCQRYASDAVAAFDSSQRASCRFSGVRWQGDRQAHLGWCLQASSQQVDWEEKARSAYLSVCTGEASGRRCHLYANSALAEQQRNLQHNCGLKGERWNADFDAHLLFCMRTPELGTSHESRLRSLQLQSCQREQPGLRCDEYAKEAVQQVNEGAARHCNFDGPRWLGSHEAHLLWCSTASQQAVTRETSERRQALASCGGVFDQIPLSQEGECMADCSTCPSGRYCGLNQQCQMTYDTRAPVKCYAKP
jgi:hypothetical protein